MSDNPPTLKFDFVSDAFVRSVIEDYYLQAVLALNAQSYLGAIVGFGSVMEGLLTWALTERRADARNTLAAKRASKKSIEQWTLETLIDVAVELDMMSSPEHALRNWRNLIHPYKRVHGSPRFDIALALSSSLALERLVHSLGGTAATTFVTAEAMNFGWLIPGVLAGCRGPVCHADLDFLRSKGIGAIVRTVEAKEQKVTKADVVAAGLQDWHESVKDFHAPDDEQLRRILAFIREMRQHGRTVAVSCGAGYGRTGTVLACWLVDEGRSADDALEYLDAVRSASAVEIRTHPLQHQLRAICGFAERVEDLRQTRRDARNS